MYHHGYGLPALIVAFLAGFLVAQFFTLQPRADIRVISPTPTQRNR